MDCITEFYFLEKRDKFQLSNGAKKSLPTCVPRNELGIFWQLGYSQISGYCFVFTIKIYFITGECSCVLPYRSTSVVAMIFQTSVTKKLQQKYFVRNQSYAIKFAFRNYFLLAWLSLILFNEQTTPKTSDHCSIYYANNTVSKHYGWQRSETQRRIAPAVNNIFTQLIINFSMTKSI